MKRIFAIAALALSAVALMASGAVAAISRSINPSAAPTGTHFVKSDATCSVTGTTVNCTGYELAGVGNSNAQGSLTANFAATVDCFNPGTNPNNPIESHQTTFSDSTTTGSLSPKNGRLAVPPLSASPTTSEVSGATSCPNPNWTAKIREGTLRLTSFTYTLHFVGFTGNYITITGP